MQTAALPGDSRDWYIGEGGFGQFCARAACSLQSRTGGWRACIYRAARGRMYTDMHMLSLG